MKKRQILSVILACFCTVTVLAQNQYYGVFTGNGSGLTNLSAAFAALATKSFFVIGTNWANVNATYVDALNGSDANNGTISFPWATIAHAQTNQNTPNGWTCAVNPGNYSVNTITNALINWYLASGATVVVANSAGTNVISGNGNVIMTYNPNAYGGPFNCTITCNVFNDSAAYGQFNGDFLTVFCQTANSIGEGGNGVALSVADTIIYCQNAYVNTPHFGNGGFPNYEIYATKSITFTNTVAVQNMIVSAPTIVISNAASLFAGASNLKFNANNIACNALDPGFAAGTVFGGTCNFDTNIIAPASFGGVFIHQ
jgi:hypothetical protein